jgi:hypothetical protein
MIVVVANNSREVDPFDIVLKVGCGILALLDTWQLLVRCLAS